MCSMKGCLPVAEGMPRKALFLDFNRGADRELLCLVSSWRFPDTDYRPVTVTLVLATGNRISTCF